jgi:hypothetical protein
MRTALAALLACSGALGCGTDLDDRPASWTYISEAIIQPNCATSSCHSRGAAVAGLDLSTRERGHKSLLGLHVAQLGRPEAPARPLVTPYVPDQSRLVHMLRADGASRMPPDRPMPLADIELIERWILAGALDD